MTRGPGATAPGPLAVPGSNHPLVRQQAPPRGTPEVVLTVPDRRARDVVVEGVAVVPPGAVPARRRSSPWEVRGVVARGCARRLRHRRCRLQRRRARPARVRRSPSFVCNDPLVRQQTPPGAAATTPSS
ncbi:hypothetical protein C8046_01705 [Serinibacter arcticus]|uniref:Uncharacterized protein n=1 Tax=Serinibacter arcticus TaxID=1655435 RepID=A0A2U1ZRJ8_9MICO|nr:hypothetical protein C8046_01705 [Serinibacter arcticus]